MAGGSGRTGQSTARPVRTRPAFTRPPTASIAARMASGRSSRRWRWLINRGLVVLLLMAGIALMLVSKGGPPWAVAVRSATLDVLSPVLNILRTPFDGIVSVGETVSTFWHVRKRNIILETELDEARVSLERLARLEQEIGVLRDLLSLKQNQPTIIGAFRIVGASGTSFMRSAILTGGRPDGLAIGQPAREGDGLVGRIVEVGQFSARVLLLTDLSSRVPVRVEASRQTAIAAGINGPELSIQFLSYGDPPKIGDDLFTSGDGGIFPPGIPVARVSRVTAEGIFAVPFANPNGLDVVVVMQPYVPEAGIPAALQPGQ